MLLADDLIQKGVLKTPRLVEAFRAVDRQDFVPEDEKDLAYLDEALPIGNEQTISQPYTVAFMLELLQPQPGENIMEIGYGSGWQTALLAYVVNPKSNAKFQTSNFKQGTMYAIERIQKLCESGNKNIEKYHRITSSAVKTYCRDGTMGLPEVAEKIGGFDKIIAAASGESVPETWREQLKIGGTIVMPIGTSLWVFTKKGKNAWVEEEYPGFVFVPLVRNDTVKHRVFNITVTNGALGFILSITATAISLLYFISPPHTYYPKEIIITEGATASEVAELLKQGGLIRSETLFLLYLSIIGGGENLQRGNHVFTKAPSLPYLAASLTTSSEGRAARTIRIPEGSSLRGAAGIFEEQGLFQKETFWRVTGEPAQDYRIRQNNLPDFLALETEFPFLKMKPYYATLEGYLYPDTYQFFSDSAPEEVVEKMIKNLEARLREEGLWEEIEKQGRSLHEILTFASLLEREASNPQDKKRIAGILNNRMTAGIPLQVDATLLYVTGRGSLLLTEEDLTLDSPYNTYVMQGLPLGPIASPGVDSIKAALFPEKTQYLYYLSDKEGALYYSKTFEEHKEKKFRYLR